MLPPSTPYSEGQLRAKTDVTLCAEWLIVFARFPEPGRTKTRLIPALGPERAAQLQAALTRHTLAVAGHLCADRSRRLEVRFTGGDVDQMSQLYGREHDCVPQQGADLGERLKDAAAAAFRAGAKQVVLIGTDCPGLDAERLQAAFQALQRSDVVLGPAFDGGYYLIGLSGHRPELFAGIDWGTEHVLRQTLAKIRAARCRVHLLPMLADVDHPEDLIECRRLGNSFGEILPDTRPDLLSIIVPTLNEESTLATTLGPLSRVPDVELIVADGGSTDATVSIARELGALVVSARKGRGRQLNTGAAFARGETLLFLHADSQLPPDFVATIRSILGQPYIAGAFRLRIAAPGWSLRCVEWAANLRSRLWQMPYGDQGLFIAAEEFFAMGGYPNWPLMEDYELCRRLRRRGRIGLAQEVIGTSARRWAQLGVWQTTLINQCTMIGFHLGISPEWLAAWYSGWSRRRRPDKSSDGRGPEPT
jgi:rSAM/selenodomain-associated transferase 2/rSAM/selenodomain-associated transferase 1